MRMARTPQSDAYLELAYQVISRARAPLSAKEIIKRAFLSDLIPAHLHGKTQHKTLTARLSIDILHHREASEFFRPWPGRFFISALINDESLPAEYRVPIIARRRARQLKREYTAYVSPLDLDGYKVQRLSPADFRKLISSNSIQYSSTGKVGIDEFQIWNFPFVRKGLDFLSYTSGRFRAIDETVTAAKTIGFPAPLTQDDRTLFDNKYHGALGAAISNVIIDLDLQYSKYLGDIESSSRFLGALIVEEANAPVLLAVSEVRLPIGCPVITRRLSINNLGWTRPAELRARIEHLEPWSQGVLRHFF
jgi:hypothetical protein